LPYEWSRLPRKGPRSDSFLFIERRRRSSHSSIPVGVIQELYPNDNQKVKEKKWLINVLGRIGQETLKRPAREDHHRAPGRFKHRLFSLRSWATVMWAESRCLGGVDATDAR
jgi:hypothetical protein